MKRITGLLAITTTIVLLVVTYRNINTILTVYGPEYLLGNIIGYFLMILVIYWILEKVYLKIKQPRK